MLRRQQVRDVCSITRWTWVLESVFNVYTGLLLPDTIAHVLTVTRSSVQNGANFLNLSILIYMSHNSVWEQTPINNFLHDHILKTRVLYEQLKKWTSNLSSCVWTWDFWTQKPKAHIYVRLRWLFMGSGRFWACVNVAWQTVQCKAIKASQFSK